MRKTGNLRKVLSGFLAGMTILSTVLSPISAYAAEITPETKPPLYEEVKDQLDADEVVKAENLELDWGAAFDVKTDFTKLEIPDKEKVKVTFEEAKNDAGEDFTTQKADTYKAVYYVEPMKTDHPKYQISRNLIVKEAPATETVIESASAADSGGDVSNYVENAGTESNNGGENADDGEGDSQTSGGAGTEAAAEEQTAEVAGTVTEPQISENTAAADQESVDAQEGEAQESEMNAADANAEDDASDESGSLEDETQTGFETDTESNSNSDSGSESNSNSNTNTDTIADSESESENESEGALSESEFDAAIEAAESQDTVDPETGLDLETVLTAAVNQDIDLLSLEEGETIEYKVSADEPMLLAANAASSTQTVSITRGTWYYYSDYGLGSYLTAPYYVKYGDISATAYCIQPSKYGPSDGTYTITRLGDSKNLAKVCYYGTKASGDDGFFKTNHPDFSAGKCFIITHLAASYANGSADAFSGANSTGQALAMELYNYCISQPEIPDVEMSFSTANVEAYIDGDSQRTPTVTFKADALQSIIFKLPSGVKLHNLSAGTTSKAGANVEIFGGTKFYLSAPLTQAADVSQTFSAKMKGSITKDYSAYKITTGGSNQDLAFVFGEGTTNEKYVSFSATWVSQATVAIIKKDQNTGKNLAGAVYGIYSDVACTKLITEMPATDANGASSVTLTKTQDTVYLKEISAPKGYVLDATSYNINLIVGKTTTQQVTDKEQTAKISLIKVDQETGEAVAQGDAALKGAVYGLYAREDIVHPDGSTGVLYKAGAQVATLTTDENGKASVEGLHLGKYYVKEISAPAGYLPDEEEHDLVCDSDGGLSTVVERECTSKEQVVKQPFQIIKAANNGKTDADLLKSAGFSAYLVSSLKVNEDGSYDFASATPVVLTADGKTEMFTDEKGYACSIALPYGKYIVRETTTPHNYKPVDDFIVTITENKPNDPQVWRVLLDGEFEAKLKIVKKDDETKQSILVAGTEFKVYDLDNQKYVEQVTTYPTTTTHKSYFTDSQGYLILPRNLKIGHYRVEEVTAPEGYTLNTNYVEITVDENTAYQMDAASGDTIIEVDYENHPVKGKLTIYKKGEMLTGFDKDFKYEEKYLAGAEFNVYAAEDIYTPDYQKNADGSRMLIYAKDALVTTVTTDDDGKATAENLPLGSYYVKEKSAPEGFVLNTKSYEVTLAYADQNTPVVEAEVTVGDERQKVSVTVEKQDAENGAVVAGAVFGIYSKEEIKNADGKVIVKADTLLQEMTSDEKGQAVCTLDLPLGKYYVKELKAPAGFVSSDEILEFDASYQGQDVKTVTLKSVKKNEPTNVEITKSDITTGVELEGASLKVLDKDGNVIDEWTSVKDQPHVIKRLTVGEEYTLREEMAPYGYLKATDVKFTVSDTAEVQKVEMKDEVPTGLLIINKKGEFLNKITLLDNAKGTVEHFFEYATGSLSEVTFDVFASEDIKAADGVSEDYFKSDEKVGTITTDATGVAQLDNLPAGKYYAKEVETAHGYVLDGEPRYIDLSYRDQDTLVITYDEKWQNARQKVNVTVLKKEKDTDRALSGGIFGLYAGDDIKNTSGEVLLEKDTLIEQKTTDDDGKITFNADLPVDGKYYVKEILAPDGFVTTGEVQEFTFEYAGAEQAEVSYDFTFENEATTVELTKTDLTTGKELLGAKLKVTDEFGNVIDEWTSTEKPHVIKELVVGKKYTMIETKPADGYVTAKSINFTIENTAEIQKHEMKDDVTKVQISKTDITGDQEIPGAKLTILDENDQVVESWTSGTEPHYIEKLTIGSYTLREEQAPKGYVLTSDVTFEVADTGEIQTVSMKNDTAKGKIILNKTDKASGEPLKGVEFELRDSKGKVLETLKTDAAGHAESGLYEIASYKDGKYDKALKYYLVEMKTLDGYTLDTTEHEVTFNYVDGNTPIVEVTFDLANEKPETPSETPGTDTTTTEGSDSPQTHTETTTTNAPKTGDNTNLWLPILLLLGSGGGMAGLGLSRRRRKSGQK